MEFAIRPARLTDAGRLAEIMNHPDVNKNMWTAPTDAAEDWVRRLDRLYKYSFVAEVGERVVGMVGLAPGQTPKLAHGGMLHLMVDPAYHGRGIGTALMHHVIDWADNTLQLHRLELGVLATNPRAQALYERLGFTVEGRRRDYGMQHGVYIDQIDMARIRPADPA